MEEFIGSEVVLKPSLGKGEKLESVVNVTFPRGRLKYQSTPDRTLRTD